MKNKRIYSFFKKEIKGKQLAKMKTTQIQPLHVF